MATGGLYGNSGNGALIAQSGTESTGLYGKSPNGSVIAQPGSETSGLYGNAAASGGTYFEWFVFQVAAEQPDTPTGGSWNFTTNTGTPPSGWENAPADAPTNPVWISIGLVNSRSTSEIIWSTPGVFSYSGQLNGSGAPTSGIGLDGEFYIQTGVTPYAIWYKNAGTWVQATGSAVYVALTGNQTIAGVKTFSEVIQGSISGNAATADHADTADTATYATSAGSAATATDADHATNADFVPYSGLTGTVPTWNQDTTGNAATADYATDAAHATNADNATLAGNVTGVVAIANGGTGASDATTARTNLGLGTAAVRDAGVALGVATLDAGGTVPLSQIPASIQGGVSYQGTWNATTNSPTLTSSVGTKGYYYVVSVAGSTNLNGITTWNIGDWAIFNGTTWEKIDNTDAVTSVNGYTGTVVLTAADIGGLGTMAVQDANAVAITGGNESGVTHSGDIIGTHLDYTPGTAPSYAEGRTWYDSTAKALAYYNDVSGVQVHIGHDLQFKVINNTGSTIPNGSPVYITGTSSGQTYPNVALARADVAATATVIGLTDGAIANGAAGYVTSIGNIDNVNTGMFTVGQVLYLSPYSAGQLMNTIPPTGITVQVGTVTFVNSSTGKIYVKQTTPLNVPASIISGTVAIANGGTGASTAAGARTNLGLGTIATQDANAVAITGGTIDNTVIGGTTPAAGTFTTLTSNGATSLVNGSANFAISDGGGTVSQFQLIGPTASLGRNRLHSIPQLRLTTNNNPIQFQTGAGTTINSDGNAQFVIAHTASAVNYVQVTGAATTKATIVSSAGSDSNISSVFQSKGTGAIDLAAGSSGVNISNGGTVTAITRAAGGSGYTTAITATLSAPTTAGGVQATANAYAGSITAVVTSGGTGYTLNDVITVVGGTGIQAQAYTVSAVSGGVITAVTVQSFGQYTALPTNPVSVTGGTGSEATLTLSNWSLTSVAVNNAGSGYVEQPTISFSGGGGSGAAAYASIGSGTTVKSLGSSISFSTPAGVQLIVNDGGGDGGNYWRIQGGASTAGVQLLANGSATNVSALYSTKGTGGHTFYTNNFAQTQFTISHTASAVNYVQVTGAATGSFPIVSSQGSDTNISLQIYSKGTGGINFWSNNGGSRQFQVAHTAGTIVNFTTATGSATGASPAFSVAGSDTNIDLTLTPKGTGNVRFGTLTASADAAITGYITIKDSGGTVRKLAVIA